MTTLKEVGQAIRHGDSIRTDVIHRHHLPPGGTLQNQGHESDILLRRYPGAGEHGDVTVLAQRLL